MRNLNLKHVLTKTAACYLKDKNANKKFRKSSISSHFHKILLFVCLSQTGSMLSFVYTRTGLIFFVTWQYDRHSLDLYWPCTVINIQDWRLWDCPLDNFKVKELAQNSINSLNHLKPKIVLMFCLGVSFVLFKLKLFWSQ